MPKLVELRLDYINGEVNLKRLLADRPCPVIITCRRQADGGRWQGTEQTRLLLLRTAIAEGVRVRSISRKTSPATIPRFGKTKRIISYHDFRKTPENLQDIHDRLAALDPDIVKLSTMANQPHDNCPHPAADARCSESRPSPCAWATWARPRASWRRATTRRSSTPRFITSGCSRPASSASSR